MSWQSLVFAEIKAHSAFVCSPFGCTKHFLLPPMLLSLMSEAEVMDTVALATAGLGASKMPSSIRYASYERELDSIAESWERVS